ncbi:MAG: FAD-dependent monooxygenase, partial [Paracoccaceae bacterium]
KVFEQSEALGEVGAGLQISPNGAVVLKALGVAPQLRALSLRANAVDLCDYRQGRLVCRLDLARYVPDLEYSFVHRADLVQLLYEACRAKGVAFEFSQTVSDLGAPDAPRITTQSGLSCTPDFVVGADGVKSMMRPALGNMSVPRFSGQVAWRAIVPNTCDHPDHAVVHMAPGRHMVSYPLRDRSGVNLVMVQERSQWAEEGWAQRDAPRNVQAAFCDFGGMAKSLLGGLDKVHLWGLFLHPVASCWGQGKMALVGDAAHPTLPFLAQGANMALEDAWVFAGSLDTQAPLQQRLDVYQARRKARVERTVRAAAGNAWKYHLSAPPLRWAAHSTMRAFAAIAPRQLVGQFDWLYRHDVTAEQS